nr:MAG TPA: hypothetical protein [Caudoviricetes sp.]DAZ01905.1 MAG TPA: hypothetical protein [Caudoviricetes sp.]
MITNGMTTMNEKALCVQCAMYAARRKEAVTSATNA